jgi:hypothetical protein
MIFGAARMKAMEAEFLAVNADLDLVYHHRRRVPL